MRDDYLKGALAVIALVESLEKLSAEDTALRAIIEVRISYELPTLQEMARENSPRPARDRIAALVAKNQAT